MNIKYKLLISSPSIYKEIELDQEEQTIKVGTLPGCDVRLYREAFFEDIELSINRSTEGCFLFCSDNLYLDEGDVRKLFTKKLEHGESLKVKYQNSDYVVFTLDFLIVFDSKDKLYDCSVDLRSSSRITIGGRGVHDIILLSPNAVGEAVTLQKNGDLFEIKIMQSTYGIYVNGSYVSENIIVGERDFFTIADYDFYYKEGHIYITNCSQLTINGLPYEVLHESDNSMKYPCFNRSTHCENEIIDEPIKVLDPSQKPTKPEGSLLASLVPALGMLALVIVIRGFMSNTSNFTYILFSVCSMTLGILTSIATYVRNKKKYKRDLKRWEEEYCKYIERKKTEITEAREQEASNLNEEYPDEIQNLSLVQRFSGDLYDRSENSRNFLGIRLGMGEDYATRKIDYPQKEHIVLPDELERMPQELAEQYEMLNDVPVVCKLKEIGNLGIVGNVAEQYEFMKVILLDLCVHHYSKEVKVVAVFEEEKKQQMHWMRLLPHVKNDMTGERLIVCDSASKTAQFEYLYKELCRRELLEDKIPNPWIVVFLMNDMGIMQHPVSRFLKCAGKYHVYFISFAENDEQLPLYCGNVVRLTGNTSGTLVDAKTARETTFTYNTIPDREMSAFVNKLAPVYCKEIELESTLTKSINFFEMINVFSVDEINLQNKWNEIDICKSMAVPIGVNAKNEKVFLDLHEKAHGPHGLVAGTTGSGKSELLQTLILSLSLQFAPQEVGFVLIDFKGGGMANQFRDLPHLIGTITDIDGEEINRSLMSIRAELDKRKELFAQANVSNINQYIEKYKEREIRIPLPHLIIIVDEFAELKAEQPEFMKELISAARIGRSLGVHLILATQKPAGQVSDQIWSNSKFKLCLKVQNQADSNEVIKSPLAADIVEPGRAYFQVGNNELFELVQTAYSGVSEKQSTDEIKEKEFVISEVDIAGRRNAVFQQSVQGQRDKGRSQLDAVVEYVNSYCAEHSIKRLPAICLPALPEVIEHQCDISTDEANSLVVDIGTYDNPSGQYQGETLLEISGNNTVIIGSAQYGKTNLLQSIIKSMAMKYTPQDVNIYIMDFASMFLKNFADLPHVGGVVCAAEEERIKNLFKLLYTEITVRKDKLVSTGVSSFAAYREAGFRDLPHIVLIIDNFTALKETYFTDEDILLPLCRDGLSVGISVIIANTQTAGFGYRYFSTISNHIAFYCNDAEEINNVFGYCRRKIDAIPGRCLVELDKTIYQAQTYRAFEGEKEIERSQNVHEFVYEQIQKHGNNKAKMIPSVPEKLSLDRAYDFTTKIDKKENFAIAVDYENIESVVLPFRNQFLLALIGEKKETKANILNVLMHDIKENIFDRMVELYIVDSVSKTFKEYCDMPYVKKYTTDTNAFAEIVEELNEELEERYQMWSEQGDNVLDSEPLKLVLVNSRRALDTFGSVKDAIKSFDNISKNYRELKVMFIFSDLENVSVPYSGSEIYKRIRDEKRALIFDSLKNVRLYDIPLQVSKKKNSILGRADAFYLNRDEIEKIKVVEG